MNIKTIGMDRNKSYSTRKNSIEQLTRLPHKDKNIHIMDCMLALISDTNIPIEQRYSSFSGNISFDNEVQRKCHLFYFNNFNPPRYPMRFKLNSAQYLLQTSVRDQIDLREVYDFLIRTSRSPSTDNVTKAECADILSRSGYSETAERIFEELAMPVLVNEYRETRRIVEPRIEDLPEARRRVLIKRRTVYDDGQNVHNTAINEGVKEIIRQLCKEQSGAIQTPNRIVNLNDVSKRLVILSKQKSVITKQKILGTMDRIMIDTSKFECDVNLCDILIMVWMKIKTSEHREELEKRLVEEMEEMNGMCATGHLSRLVNVLSGFFDNMSVKISYKDQMKNYVYNYYNRLLMSDKYSELSEKIIDEMTESTEDKKENLLRMIKDNNYKEQLRKDFPDILQGDFDDWYKTAVNSYCGL